MSPVDDLIKRLCPNGVEFKTLDSVCEVLNGYAFKSALFNSDGDGLPLIRIRDVNTGFSDTYYSGDYDQRYIVENGDILIGMDGDFRAIRWKHGRALLNQRVCRLEKFGDDMLPDFMCYEVQDELDRIQSGTQGSTVKHLSSRELERSRIPVPPLEVQREIVRVLDLFMGLEAGLESELNGELQARRIQYTHHRDSVLAFRGGDGTRWVTIPEIATNLDSRRKPVTRSARTPGEIPYYGASGIVDYVSDYIFDGDYLLVSEDGANLLARSTPIAFSISGKTWVNNHAHILEFPTYTERRFVEIYLNSIDLAPFVTGGAQAKLSQTNLNKIPIPVPSIEEQERIVSFLDKFKALVDELSVSLSAELKSRRKQYEHYRDRLLAFKELAV